MDAELRRAISSKGGQSVPSEKRSFALNRDLAVAAGRKGGAHGHDGTGLHRAEKLLGVAGKCLLLAEDDYLIAEEMVFTLEQHGAEVVGPVPTVSAALELIATESLRLDGAVLDINLRDERVFPVATLLSRKGIPFVFVTGYGRSAIPGLYSSVPLFEKPLSHKEFAGMLPFLKVPAPQVLPPG
jgi:general stress protein YciG/CheY-like chemotaxis protein